MTDWIKVELFGTETQAAPERDRERELVLKGKEFDVKRKKFSRVHRRRWKEQLNPLPTQTATESASFRYSLSLSDPVVSDSVLPSTQVQVNTPSYRNARFARLFPFVRDFTSFRFNSHFSVINLIEFTCCPFHFQIINWEKNN